MKICLSHCSFHLRPPSPCVRKSSVTLALRCPTLFIAHLLLWLPLSASWWMLCIWICVPEAREIWRGRKCYAARVSFGLEPWEHVTERSAGTVGVTAQRGDRDWTDEIFLLWYWPAGVFFDIKQKIITWPWLDSTAMRPPWSNVQCMCQPWASRIEVSALFCARIKLYRIFPTLLKWAFKVTGG